MFQITKHLTVESVDILSEPSYFYPCSENCHETSDYRLTCQVFFWTQSNYTGTFKHVENEITVGLGNKFEDLDEKQRRKPNWVFRRARGD